MLNTPDIQRPLPQNIENLRGRKDPEAVKAVAKEMEAMFAYEMIKVMRETTMSSTGTFGSDTYMSMFDMQLSRLFAERGIGLGALLEKGIKAVAEKTPGAPQAPDKLKLNSRKEEKQTPEKIPDAPQAPDKLKLNSRKVEKQTLNEEIKTLMPDINQSRISSGYGLRHDPFSGHLKFHEGIDIPASEGTEIHALRGGAVIFSGEQQGYGNVVIIDHGDGFLTKYAHNRINLVQQGQKVDTGSVIAQVGSTGKSTGPHMHFEVLFKGEHVNPDQLLAMKKD